MLCENLADTDSTARIPLEKMSLEKSLLNAFNNLRSSKLALCPRAFAPSTPNILEARLSR